MKGVRALKEMRDERSRRRQVGTGENVDAKRRALRQTGGGGRGNQLRLG